MSLDAQLLRQAMRAWATGVTIVSSHAGGERHGMTVSSFTSISLDPPLVLVSLSQGSRTGELLLRSGEFGVTILSAGQREISERFSGRIPDDADRFVGVETETLATGVPFVRGGLAYFDCRLVTRYPAGTNTLFIGEVVAARSLEAGEPLVYFDQGYRKLEKG